jgi:hypothetical protein
VIGIPIGNNKKNDGVRIENGLKDYPALVSATILVSRYELGGTRQPEGLREKEGIDLSPPMARSSIGTGNSPLTRERWVRFPYELFK